MVCDRNIDVRHINNGDSAANCDGENDNTYESKNVRQKIIQ